MPRTRLQFTDAFNTIFQLIGSFHSRYFVSSSIFYSIVRFLCIYLLYFNRIMLIFIFLVTICMLFHLLLAYVTNSQFSYTFIYPISFSILFFSQFLIICYHLLFLLSIKSFISLIVCPSIFRFGTEKLFS